MNHDDAEARTAWINRLLNGEMDEIETRARAQFAAFQAEETRPVAPAQTRRPAIQAPRATPDAVETAGANIWAVTYPRRDGLTTYSLIAGPGWR